MAKAAAAKSVQDAEDALKKARKHKHLVRALIHQIKSRQMGGSVTAMWGDAYIRTMAGDLRIGRDFILQQGGLEPTRSDQAN